MLTRTTPFILILLLALLIASCAPSPQPLANPTLTSAPTLAPTPLPPTPQPTDPPPPTATTEPTPEPITLTDGTGRAITLEAPPQRIVSLAPSNTEILFAVGAGSQVVGRDMFSDYPPEALDAADIGGGFGQINMEVIAMLQPDLILAADINPPEQVKGLEDLGYTVFTLPNPTDMTGMFANLITVGQLTGHEAEAQQLIDSLQDRVAAVEEKVASLDDRLLVFYELDATEPNAPWTSGPGTFIDMLITMAGGENLGRVLQSEWAQISVEELLVQDPDVIVLGSYTWGGVTPEDVAARNGWEGLSAVKNQRIYTIDDNLVSRPGPRMVDGLEELARLLYPDLFD